jgi:glycosidase
LLGGDAGKVALAFTFLFAFPGAPAVYYGDEVGLKGGKDPECRGAFPWNESAWQPGLREHVRRLAALRRRMPVLRRGEYRSVLADDRRGCLAFARMLGEDSVVAALNCSATPRSLRLPVSGLGLADGRILHNLLGAEEYIVQGDEVAISLPPWSGVWMG